MIIEVCIEPRELELPPDDFYVRYLRSSITQAKFHLISYPNEPVVIEIHMNEGQSSAKTG